MKTILNNDILKEMPNQQALGSFNTAISFGANYNTQIAANEIRGFLDAEKIGKESSRSLDKIAEVTGTNRDTAIGLVNDFEQKDTRRETYNKISKLTRVKVLKEAKEKGFIQQGFKTTRTRKK
jgi:hypothetical protein